MANPYDKYAKAKENPYEKYAPPEDTLIDQAAKSPVGRAFANIPIGTMQLPGVPIELMFTGGNFLRRQMDLPETQLENSIAKDWGAEGWRKFFEGHVGKANIPAPTSEIERIADKTGQFVGGGLPFGPAGLAPSLTGVVGSEIGRVLDKEGISGGYGEPAGAVVGAGATGLVRGQATSGVESAPSIAALRAAKNAAYTASEREGAIFTPAAMQRLYSEAAADATNFGHAAANEPGIAAALKELDNLQNSNVTLKGLDTVRKQVSNAGKNYQNQAQVALSGRIKDVIDNFLDTLQPGEVLSGNYKRAVDLIKQARSINQRYRLGQQIEEARYQATNQAASSGVGGNIENAMRQKIKAILNNPKRRASFNASERKLMERINHGSWSQNRLRQIGGFAPSKGFLPAALLAQLGLSAAGAGVPAGVTIPAALAYTTVTSGAKKLGESLTSRNIDRLSAAVRNERNAAPPTPRQRANHLLLEMKRRAALAAQASVPGAIGAANQR